jgi:hypothetical protein
MATAKKDNLAMSFYCGTEPSSVQKDDMNIDRYLLAQALCTSSDNSLAVVHVNLRMTPE